MSDVFTRSFSIKRVFTEPCDVYIVKEHDMITCYQVCTKELYMKKLFVANDLTGFSDYCRIAKKHTFDEYIEISCAGDLVLVDGEVCNLCELPAVISRNSN